MTPCRPPTPETRDMLARAQEALNEYRRDPIRQRAENEFIAAAHTLIPELVDELTQRRAEVARLQGQLARMQACR